MGWTEQPNSRTVRSSHTKKGKKEKESRKRKWKINTSWLGVTAITLNPSLRVPKLCFSNSMWPWPGPHKLTDLFRGSSAKKEFRRCSITSSYRLGGIFMHSIVIWIFPRWNGDSSLQYDKQWIRHEYKCYCDCERISQALVVWPGVAIVLFRKKWIICLMKPNNKEKPTWMGVEWKKRWKWMERLGWVGWEKDEKACLLQIVDGEKIVGFSRKGQNQF